VDWRRISKILFWIFAIPPVGLWMLWQDPVLPRALKLRILFYGVFGMVAFAVLFSMYEIHSVQKALNAAGVG
jgi:hypothetical protein